MHHRLIMNHQNDIKQDLSPNVSPDETAEWLSEWSLVEFHLGTRKSGVECFSDYNDYIATREEHEADWRAWKEETRCESMHSRKGRDLDDNDMMQIIMSGNGDAYGY